MWIRVLTVLVLLLLVGTSALFVKVRSLESALSEQSGEVSTGTGLVKVQGALSKRIKRLEQSSARMLERVRRLEVHRGSVTRIEPASDTATLSAQTLEELKIAGVEAAVVDRVEEALEAKVSEIVTRPRTGQGEWIAPVDELSELLSLSPEASERVTQVFNTAHDASFELLSKTRDDGGSMLDDLVGDLRELGQPRGFQRWLGRLGQTEVPDGEGTYAQAYGALRGDVLSSLSTALTDEQMRRFEDSKVAPLRVNTGHDPVRRYVESALE